MKKNTVTIKPLVQPKQLPKKLSDVIRLAVKDMREVQAGIEAARAEGKTPAYRFYMMDWHSANPREKRGQPKCAVCFAGSVMAGTLGAKPTVSYNPSAFDWQTTYKLEALNDVRTGDLFSAMTYADMWVRPTLNSCDQPETERVVNARLKIAKRVALTTLRVLGWTDPKPILRNALGRLQEQLDITFDPGNGVRPFEDATTVSRFLKAMSVIADALEREGY